MGCTGVTSHKQRHSSCLVSWWCHGPIQHRKALNCSGNWCSPPIYISTSKRCKSNTASPPFTNAMEPLYRLDIKSLWWKTTVGSQVKKWHGPHAFPQSHTTGQTEPSEAERSGSAWGVGKGVQDVGCSYRCVLGHSPVSSHHRHLCAWLVFVQSLNASQIMSSKLCIET